MEKITFLLMLLFVVKNTVAQFNTANRPGDLFTISAGPNRVFFNNRDFNAWTAANYNLIEKVSQGFVVDFSFIGRRLGGGLLISQSLPFTNATGYFGFRLTNPYSSISSRLNIEVGEIYAKFTNIAPVNYRLTPDEVGQKMELHYNAGYIGLSTRNYLNFLHWNLKIGRTKIPINTGMYASVGFTPFARNWRFGYYEKCDTVFTNKKVNTIPKLSKVYANTGIFIGF